MSAERVDKQWQQKGISAYSTEAILGTLRHYGVALDEGSLKSVVESAYPIQLATTWQAAWKGTGQFSRFHIVAAEELSRRALPERLLPSELAGGMVGLMKELLGLLEDKPDARVGAELKKVEALRARVPLKDGKADPAFTSEVAVVLGEWMKVLGRLAQDLAKAGHVDDAEAFADLEEFVFPQWQGISKAMVRAAKGEKDAAIQDLVRLVEDEGKEGPTRITALDGLIHLEELEKAKALALPLLDEAEAAKDFHFALEIGERLMFLLDRTGDTAGLRGVAPRLQKLSEEHATAHPHHHH